MKKEIFKFVALVINTIFIFIINFIVGLTFDSYILKILIAFLSAILSSIVVAIIYND